MLENLDLPVRVVCATRLQRDEFLHRTATGKSLASCQLVSPVEIQLFPENRRGLSEVYNEAIEKVQSLGPAILVFVHDDVLFTDFFWCAHLIDGLRNFDIVGLAGTTRRFDYQESWAFADMNGSLDSEKNLSGSVGFAKNQFPVAVKPYGPVGRKCKLLDGLFLAARSDTLIRSGLRFDPEFKFHFYDMDFCRSAETLGLTMGTVGISVVHESGGGYGPEWRDVYAKYIDKWGS